MKKTFLVVGIFTLLISGCQLIPVLLPTPSASITEYTDTLLLVETMQPIKTPSPIATASLTVSPTSAQTYTPSPVPLPSGTPTSLPIVLQTGSPVHIQNFVHTDEGCDWIGMAGQVFDANNQPINNLVVNVKGKLGQTEIDKIAVTGIPEANVYGPGGYEIKIADKTVVSENTLSIQVFDLNGNSLSKPIPFNTYSDCSKNLIIINFQTK